MEHRAPSPAPPPAVGVTQLIYLWLRTSFELSEPEFPQDRWIPRRASLQHGTIESVAFSHDSPCELVQLCESVPLWATSSYSQVTSLSHLPAIHPPKPIPRLGGHSLKTHWFPSVGQASSQTKHFNISLSRTSGRTSLFQNSLFEGNPSQLIAGPRGAGSPLPAIPRRRRTAISTRGVGLHRPFPRALPHHSRLRGKAPPAATVPRWARSAKGRRQAAATARPTPPSPSPPGAAHPRGGAAGRCGACALRSRVPLQPGRRSCASRRRWRWRRVVEARPPPPALLPLPPPPWRGCGSRWVRGEGGGSGWARAAWGHGAGPQRGLCAGQRPGSRSRPTGPRRPGAPAVRCVHRPLLGRPSVCSSFSALVLAVRLGTPPKCRRRGQDVALLIRDAIILSVASFFLPSFVCWLKVPCAALVLSSRFHVLIYF